VGSPGGNVDEDPTAATDTVVGPGRVPAPSAIGVASMVIGRIWEADHGSRGWQLPPENIGRNVSPTTAVLDDPLASVTVTW